MRLRVPRMMNIFEDTCENPDSCDNEECAEHGSICGACSSYIIEETEMGNGEAYFMDATNLAMLKNY